MNTSSMMGEMKEILVDHSIHGKNLPSNIIFCAAINPEGSEKQFNEKNKKSRYQTKSNREYIVKKTPASIQTFILDYNELTLHQANDFIHILINDILDLHLKAHFKFAAKELNYFAHKFIKELNVKKKTAVRYKMSIQNIMRTMKLFNWFVSKDHNMIRSSGKNGGYFSRFWRALLMSIDINYYVELTKEERDDFVENIRKTLKHIMSTIENDGELSSNKDYLNYLKLDFLHVYHEELMNLYNRSSIPDGIDRTFSLMENLYCTVVSICAKIPIMIVGTPRMFKDIELQLGH